MRNKSSSESARVKFLHPGQHVRDTVLTPKGMWVTEAAEIIRVSRPATSNFLNGKVATTPDMASRIERAFKIPAPLPPGASMSSSRRNTGRSGPCPRTNSFLP